MIKVPCGGFKLDENFLGVNENDELSLLGGSEGKAYQQLVTGGDGGVKWEDRLAYDGSRLVVDTIDGVQAIKVSDEIPSWVSIDAPIKIWQNNDDSYTEVPESYIDLGNGSFFSSRGAAFIVADNTEFNNEGFSFVFPEKGVYFLRGDEEGYVSGIASADSDTPEITWDGNVEFTKTIDPKYIPSELNEIVLPSSASGSSKKFKITVNDSGTITATEVTT